VGWTTGSGEHHAGRGFCGGGVGGDRHQKADEGTNPRKLGGVVDVPASGVREERRGCGWVLRGRGSLGGGREDERKKSNKVVGEEWSGSGGVLLIHDFSPGRAAFSNGGLPLKRKAAVLKDAVTNLNGVQPLGET